MENLGGKERVETISLVPKHYYKGSYNNNTPSITKNRDY
jgi:hypothetical protein